MMQRSFYSDTITSFRKCSDEEIIGKLVLNNQFPLIQTQRDAWKEQIHILRNVLQPYEGSIYFEYTIPRMGKRVDVVLM